MKQLNVTELDFDEIKSTLKTYYTRSDSPFKDWDFTGAGLDLLLDVLAYNTHYNAVLAHLASNEGFLGSAQLRKNIVARANTLGYIPSSYSAPTTTITLGGSDIASLTSVPSGTIFRTTVDGESFSYITTESFTFSGGAATKQVVARQGSLKTVNYIFDSSAERQKFTIPDITVDTSTLTVSSSALGGSVATSYTRFTELSDITPTSNVYFIKENPNGFYEIEFGDNVLGKKPSAADRITLTYLLTDGNASNGATTFSLASTLTDSGGSPINISVSSATISSGGALRETIEEIRTNAPLTFLSQDRAVTADDYKAVIQSQSNNAVKYVSVWGGEDNIPQNLGSVYISMKGEDDSVISNTVKDSVRSVLENKGVLTLDHIFVDPTFNYLYFDVLVKYNSNLTTLSASSLSTAVVNTIDTFGSANLEDFSSVFRYSNFLSTIDNSNAAIISTSARVNAYQKFTRLATDTDNVTLDFTFAIDRDDNLSSSEFVSGGVTYKLKTEGDQSDIDDNVEKRIVMFSDESSTTADFGKINYGTGVVTIEWSSLYPVDSTTEIKIYLRPASNDIVAKRSYIISLDTDLTTVTSEVDTIALRGNAGVSDYVTQSRDA